MRQDKLVLLGLCATILLAGASCGRSGNQANLPAIGRVVLASSIQSNNAPDNDLEQVSAGTGVLYLTAEVLRPSRSTTVAVTWYKMPAQVITTEEFNGSRSGSTSNRNDFDDRFQSSWLASQVQRPGSSWSLGDYKAEVRLNGKLSKTLFFSVVRDSDAERDLAARMISSVQFSDAVGDDNLIVGGKSTFARDADHLYVQLNFATTAKPGTDIRVSIRYIKEDLVVNTFSAVVGSDSAMVFDLARDRFGKLWPDKLWPSGSFEVVVRMNGVVAKTLNFQVKA